MHPFLHKNFTALFSALALCCLALCWRFGDHFAIAPEISFTNAGIFALINPANIVAPSGLDWRNSAAL